MGIYVKRADEVVDYGWDWAAELGDDTIATSAWTLEYFDGDADELLTDSSHDTTTTTVRVGAGGLEHLRYRLLNTIATAAGLTLQKAHTISVREASGWWPGIEDLAAFLHRNLDDLEMLALAALDEAVGVVQAEGQLLEPGTSTVAVRANAAGLLELPQIPARSITSVTAWGRLVDTAWYRPDLTFGLIVPVVQRWGWEPITVVYEHGFDTIPRVVRNVVLALAARHISNPDGAYDGQDYEGFHARFRLFPQELSDTEARILGRFQRLPSSAIRFVDQTRVFPRG